MKTVKCRFKGLSESAKLKLEGSSCLLTISVGQEYHEGDKFEATIELINKTFEQCKIMLYDGLQRYTMTLHNPGLPDQFLNAAISEGDEWLKRNAPNYKQLDILTEIIRWDHWLKHPDFFEKKQMVIQAIQNIKEYNQAFEDTIHQYLSRYTKRLPHGTYFNKKHAYFTCLSYLIEECAALCLWHETQCDYEVYPNLRNPAMDATHNLFILPEHPDQLYSIPLKFINKKQLSPQTFNSISQSLTIH